VAWRKVTGKKWPETAWWTENRDRSFWGAGKLHT
jgi:hypothetical protein